MDSRTYTTPAIYYTLISIIGGLNVFSTVNPVMVYVKYQCEVIFKLEACVKSPFCFIILDCDCVTCLWGKFWQYCFDAFWTFATRDVYVDLEILELFAVAHPTCDIHMVFKLLYRTLYNFIIITCKHSKLSRMHR